jgi:Fic family protein
MNLELMRGGYPPIIIHPEHRPDYIDSLEKAQLTGDSTDFKNFLLERLESSLDEYLGFFIKA